MSVNRCYKGEYNELQSMHILAEMQIILALASEPICAVNKICLRCYNFR